MKLKIVFLLMIIPLSMLAQKINLYFPYFSGKSYDFIIFQGHDQKTITQGIIPENGRFTLTIPSNYNSYVGMSRWLITGTKEGGGLDMYIPGRDFSVSCDESEPNDKNIVYINNTGNPKLNELYLEQEKILSRYEAMKQALNVFDKNDKNYLLFNKEYDKQSQNYLTFQNLLKKKSDYISGFIKIVNLTRGLGTRLFKDDNKDRENKALDMIGYINNDLNWQYLYTSGHWDEIINIWTIMQTQVLKLEPKIFVKNYVNITKKLSLPHMIDDFTQRITNVLSQQKNEDYLKTITDLK